MRRLVSSTMAWLVAAMLAWTISPASWAGPLDSDPAADSSKPAQTQARSVDDEPELALEKGLSLPSATSPWNGRAEAACTTSAGEPHRDPHVGPVTPTGSTRSV